MKLKLIILFFALGVNFTYSQTGSCGAATALTVNSCTTNITVNNSTIEAPSPSSCGTAVRDMWRYFDATASTATITNTTTQNANIAFAVYAGTCVSGLITPTTEFNCTNAVSGNVPQTETAILSGLTIGARYYIRFFSVNAFNATHRVCIRSVPDNDDPSGAFSLPTPTAPCNYLVGDLRNASKTACLSAPSCSSYGSNSVDVWFKVTVPASGDLFLQTTNSSGDSLGMATYTGTPCAGLTELVCSDGHPEGSLTEYPSIYVNGQPSGSTVYVRVWNKNGSAANSFSICASTLGPCGNDLSGGDNDYCENPYAIYTTGVTGTMTSTNYTVASPPVYTYDAPGGVNMLTCAFGDNSWYTFVPTTNSVSIPVSTGNCEVDLNIFETALNQYGCCKSFVPLSAPSVTLGDCSAETYSIGANSTGTITANSLTPGNTYYLMATYPGGVCTFSVTGWAYSGILPVDMLLFNASNDNLKNSITWVTANENGVKQYVLQKSKDGVNFEDFDWLVSKGITTEKNTYYATDGKPYELTYYRIKIIYQQGNEKYTNIISVNIANSIDNLQSVYPNPTTADLNFEYYLKNAGNIQVSLVDYAGKTAFENTYQLTEGKNKLSLPMSTLENGVYILKVVAEKSGKTTYNKVVKN